MQRSPNVWLYSLDLSVFCMHSWVNVCFMLMANLLNLWSHTLTLVILSMLVWMILRSIRTSAFIGQVNNVLCYFNTLNSHTKYRLFQSYSTSFYGCELWCLLDDEVQSLCTAWRKSIRKIWEQPYRTHSYLLPLLCCSLPLFDQLCIRSLNFVQRCLAHDSDVVNLFLTIVLSMVVAILVLVRM